jgi:hypothetical protein
VEALVLRQGRHSVAKCSSSAVEAELASFWQLLRPPLEVVVLQSVVLRMRGWVCFGSAVVVAAMMLLVRVELEEVLVSVSSRCLSGRIAVAVR